MGNIPQRETLFCDLGAFVRPLVISAVGAGGKTSTLFWLADLFRQAGRRVLITTTTHMFMPAETCPVMLCRDPTQLPSACFQHPLAACFSRWLPDPGKVRGFSPQIIDALAARADCDVILVEADGAHGFGIKAPDEHEPCIPQASHCVIAVTGGEMLGQPVGPGNVHRWPVFSRITGAAPEDVLDLPMLFRLINHPLGAFKGVPPGCRRIWLLNQISQNEKFSAPPFSAVLEHGETDAIWLGAVQETPAITRRFVR
ncbi:selenium cofactor biosynthesis protein YqeC [Trabulsiella odontotermitis]|uniref:Selenium-dependent hydroxylase accessory protein YqeC n=1 Tax=Trabulsiella odontotermitis TaxID=379893 RepID=A0A0L0H466_9ENTR|nr:selenium cofactor biosynthesis protein YqeC [Trabulsiella odontotermitis]KNC95711.1 hypothetical protein GM31_22620 [Trabulsiella odontotermitis]